jgi:CubicO group peptidase (beta-lactamase class C family)
VADVQVLGEVDEGFGKVRDTFARNFSDHGEVGAAFSLYVGGRKVVDLWGGVADTTTGRAWEQDTLQLVFSTTKGATAICALRLAERGELDLDAPAAAVWPEFKAAGKESVPARWLMSHRVGLPVVDRPLTDDEVLDWDTITSALAASATVWEPGTKHGYHALTYGWLVGELVRRVSGKGLGTFFRDEVAQPLGLDFHIGLPEALEPRVSRLETMVLGGGGDSALAELDVEAMPPEIQRMIKAFTDPESLTNRALGVSKPPLDFNSRKVHAAEIPAANGITDARSLARMYAATIGEVDGVRLLSDETVAQATTTQSEGPDEVLMAPTKFGLGFMLASPFTPMTSDHAFGHSGAGGSLGFADPDSGVGFGYVMNKMQSNLGADPRTLTLIEAVRSCVG